VTSQSNPEPDPRKKRALVIGGIIVLAAIGWNADGWGDDNDVRISVSSDGEDIHEARDAIHNGIREEIRASFRGDDETSDEDTDEDEADADAEDTDQATTGEAGAGERQVVETESDENQRSFRIEGDDGRGVTISVDTDTAE
jgi:hypothetical protein